MKLTINHTPLRHGDGDADWKDSLPEEMRGDAAFADIKDLAALGTSFINAQKMIGQPNIRIPSAEAGEEDMLKFHEKIMKHAPNLMPVPAADDEAGINVILGKMGRPADADTYALEGATLTPEMKTLAHGMGLTQAQFAKLYEGVYKPNMENASAGEAALKSGRDLLAKEWGYAFQTKEQQAQAILEKTGAPAKLVEQAKAGKLGAETLRWMDSLVTSLGSEGLNIVGNSGGGDARITPTEATAQINEMMNNPAHPYWHATDPGSPAARKTMIDLQRIAHPK
jgi:hypothetical protein